MPIKEITLKSEPLFGAILADYCENVEGVPTQKCKEFFREWNERVPAKLIGQCIFAGIYYAIAHPEDVEVSD